MPLKTARRLAPSGFFYAFTQGSESALIVSVHKAASPCTFTSLIALRSLPPRSNAGWLFFTQTHLTLQGRSKGLDMNKQSENNGAGRPKGSPNKATQAAREAIAAFVEGNAHRLTGWLDQVANGDPENDIKPNPEKAFAMFQSVVEYHVPKLARTEVTGANGGPVVVAATTLDERL